MLKTVSKKYYGSCSHGLLKESKERAAGKSSLSKGEKGRRVGQKESVNELRSSIRVLVILRYRP